LQIVQRLFFGEFLEKNCKRFYTKGFLFAQNMAHEPDENM
jgi:hypothetical protein